MMTIYHKALALLAVSSVAACGGSSSSGDTEMITDPPGASDPIFAIATPSVVELNGLFSFNRGLATDFDVNNRSPLTQLSGGSADFDGGFQVSVNNTQEYLSGDLDLRFNLVTGTGTGEVNNLNIAGNDVENRLLSIFDGLDVVVPTVSGSAFSGTVSGTYRDRAQDPADGFADYVVDTTLDGRFVEGSPTDGLLGVVSGTITDPDRGTVPVFGVIAGDRSVTD